MAAIDGANVLLYVGDAGSPQSFVLIGGFTANSLALNETPVDITNKSSTGKWRELLRAGVKSVSISGSGVFLDAAVDETLRANAMTETTLRNFQLLITGFGTFEGEFLIASLNYDGPDKAAVTFNISLESSGQIDFVAA